MLAMKLHIAHLIWSDYIKKGSMGTDVPAFAKELFYQYGSGTLTKVIHLYLHNGQFIDGSAIVGMKLVMVDPNNGIQDHSLVFDPYFILQDFNRAPHSYYNTFYYAYNYTI